MIAPPSGVLLVDKPAGITSTRALGMARRALAAAKAGHTGTLDPFATGLLPLVFGEATKFSRFLLDSAKSYEATLSLGEETDSGDPECSVRRITDEMPISPQIDDVLCKFTGDILQTPPMHSAIHHAGKRLYEYAREGVEVPRNPRQVHVFALQRVQYEGRRLVLSVTCSKGTYVRVLAADVGRALGCGAYLAALRRTAVGAFSVAAAASLDELAAMGAGEACKRLLPPEVLVAGLPRIEADVETAVRFSHGIAIDAPELPAEGHFAVFGAGGAFLGVGERQGGQLAPSRLVAERPKSPDFA